MILFLDLENYCLNLWKKTTLCLKSPKPYLVCGAYVVIFFFFSFPPSLWCFIIDLALEEGSVKELQRKRHSATPGTSLNGRVRKAAKWKPPSDVESDEESESGLYIVLFFLMDLVHLSSGKVYLIIIHPSLSSLLIALWGSLLTGLNDYVLPIYGICCMLFYCSLFVHLCIMDKKLLL